ncbi:hypothetical protein [Geofilum rubicundum]|uniref:Uncharacterized protein n=1 Tax=Geofilum rubicundum JCM 15548 TaxID=1236989 RepID=A0A0E9LX40_9BACT|nr:hypothetical protein [Geofilum rubicundum]GAO29701.1 hypothetical protein JCM15548_11920 [Geofilum rubicundum JCM 15548]
MKSILILLFAAMMAVSVSTPAQTNEVDSLLLVLDKELKNRNLYTQQREAKIAFLKGTLAESSHRENRYAIHQKLFQPTSLYL